MPEAKWRAITVYFPEPVELPDKWQQHLVYLVGEACDAYEAAHPDRVMWPAGVGQRITFMPMTREEERSRGLEFDETTFAIDCSERERYEGERAKPRVPDRERQAVRWAKIGYMLAQLYEGEEARLWMGLANKSLDGKRPRECEPEEIEPVLQALLDAAPRLARETDLMRFYGVSSLGDLVAAQDAHIAKLQAKTKPAEPVFPASPRQG